MLLRNFCIFVEADEKVKKANFEIMKNFVVIGLLFIGFMSYGQAPGCPNVTAGPDIQLDCNTNCADVDASFLQTGFTTDYRVSAVPFVPPFSSFGGTPTSVNTDDNWSSLINLPFDFCFYGNTFDEILVGSNGNITFDTVNNTAGGFCGFTLNAADQLPVISNGLVGNSINGVFQDIDPRFGSADINYSILGTAPCRTFVVNYARVPIYNGGSANGSETTTQIVLYETTNVIEVYVRNKPDTSPANPIPNDRDSSNGGLAVLGIQNATGTLAHVPTGRNTSLWSASFEGWRFTPSGGNNFTFSWRDSAGAVLSSMPTYTHCVTQSETITARVDYTSCNGSVITVTDDVIIDITNPIIDLGPNLDLCDDALPVILDSGIISTTGTIEWYRDMVLIMGANGPTYTVNQDGVYEVVYTESICMSSDTIDITVSPTPVANTPMDMIGCDDVSNDGIANFILSSRMGMILGTQNPADFNISYHSSQADADADTGALSSSGYTNAGTGPETIFVRIESMSNALCYDTTSFIIQVDPQAVFNPPTDLEVCDDVSNDGFEMFDLTSNEIDVLGTQNAVDFTITYHNSQMDADMNAAAIPNPAAYTNLIASQETIFVRVTPNGNMNCYATGMFDIIVTTTPTANLVGDLTLCDDSSNDGTELFDLSTQLATILGAQNAVDVSITFHPSQADADGNTGALSLNFNNNSSPQTIFVRTENVNNTDCFSTTTFDLILNPAPSVTAAANLELCDDPSGDGVEIFDITQNEAAVLNGQAAANFIITYHLSQVDADAAASSIVTLYNNTTSPETIFVRVENIITGCFNTTTFDLILNGIPAIAAVPNLEECDEDGDTVSVFSLRDRATDIANGQTGVTVVYYESNMDALNNVGALDENSFSNTVNPQTISYRLTNTTTGCFAIGDFIIEAVPAPVAVMPMNVADCDDGSGAAVTDLSAVTPQVIGAQTGVTVSYHESQNDADADINAVSSNYNYNSNTTLFIRVEDDNTDCVSFTTVNLIINPLPQPNLLSQYVLCIDPNGVLLNGPEVLDTGLNDTDYTFEWFLNGTTIAGAISAIHNAIEPGDYEVMVTAIATGCDNTTTTNVRQSGIPTSYSVDVTTETYAVDHQVIATATGPDEYWFRLDDGPYVNSGIFNNVTPGLHSVTIAERSGCGEIIVEVFVFGYPDFFTPNNDGYHDTWNIIGADRLPLTRLYVFDRYGKLLKQLDTTGPGWDGIYNGQPLPSSDYWFKIEYEQDGRKGEATGHFAIKR